MFRSVRLKTENRTDSNRNFGSVLGFEISVLFRFGSWIRTESNRNSNRNSKIFLKKNAVSDVFLRKKNVRNGIFFLKKTIETAFFLLKKQQKRRFFLLKKTTETTFFPLKKDNRNGVFSS